jgi:putative peptide zinc metalloprotease protein
VDNDTKLDSAVEESLKLADGVELLGKYRGSGLQEAPYLLRRKDGQVVQVTRLIYLIASRLDAGRHPEPADRRLDEVAGAVSSTFGQEVTADNVAYLVDKKLRPTGLVAAGDYGQGDLPRARANPLLALRLRLPLVPERAHRVVSHFLEPLFRPPVVLAVLAGLVMVDLWLILGQSQDLMEGTRQIIYHPQLLLGLTFLTIVGGAFHELGHAAAARYSGATPGAMGAGVYLVWPVFYTDVTDAYRLDRRGRLRTDLGGVYFNTVFALLVTAAYLQTDFQPLLVFVVVIQMETARQFLPFVRLDGYYVVSDLAGVPNLFAYIRPVLVTLLRRGDDDARRAARAKLAELHPRARRIITAWVCLTVPVLLVNVAGFLVIAPRLAGAVWGSAGTQLQSMTVDGQLGLVATLNGVIGLILLALPLVGMSYVIARLLARLAMSAKTWWHARPLATATAGLVALTLVMLQVAVEWPQRFANALQQAQLAQQGQVADRDDGAAELAAIPYAPAAEAVLIDVARPGQPEVPDSTEMAATPVEEGSEVTETSRTSSGSSRSTETESTTTPPSSDPEAATAPSASLPPSETTTSTGPERTEVPAPAGPIEAGPAETPPTSASSPTTPSTTEPPPPPSTTPPPREPNLLLDLIDILF